jgi:hypothetical protein
VYCCEVFVQVLRGKKKEPVLVSKSINEKRRQQEINAEIETTPPNTAQQRIQERERSLPEDSSLSRCEKDV